MTRTFRLPALALALALCPIAARGQIPRDEGFMKPPAAVQNRLYSLDGKSDLGAFFAFSIKNRLTEHYGALVNYNYQFSEFLALDVIAGGGYGGVTKLTENVRLTARLNGTTDDLEDAGSLLATGQIGLRLTPAYGKLSLASEIPVHFHAYFDAGVGGVLVRYNGILQCAQALVSKKCPNDNFRAETTPNLGFNVGGGFRFIFDQRFSARVEFRNIMFFDRYMKDVNLAAPAGSGSVETSGLTHTPLVMLGVGFLL